MPVQTILITGASRGLGRQLALQYAAPGINLILVAKNDKRLTNIASLCQGKGAHTIYKHLDIQDAVTLSAFLQEIDNTTPIDMIIANAGVSSTLKPQWKPESLDSIKQMF